ncbi:Usher syndrome type-1C protein-binding protein 1 [Gracilinanus agilis]|uniref:Usher syndrome type-1C protein-binding protein 1 n=1 Tax=Gracilinanus agilis TaxID=191870 RepID=UPI001CFCA042|nr:Usher syndrome type-1C protein-binding protein 1 [Gracilinanus agilis]
MGYQELRCNKTKEKGHKAFVMSDWTDSLGGSQQGLPPLCPPQARPKPMMSSRATRPRSRRGRVPPPVELDPVVESTEEAEAVGSSVGPEQAPRLPPEESPAEPLVTSAEKSHGGHCQRLDRHRDEQTEASEPSNSLTPGKVPIMPASPPSQLHQPSGEDAQEGHGSNLYLALQQAVESLEKAAASCRQQASSLPASTTMLGPEEPSKADEDNLHPLQRLEELVRSWSPVSQEEGLPEQERIHYKREALSLTEQNASLRSSLKNKEDELAQDQASLQAFQDEKEMLQRQVWELHESLLRLDLPPAHPLSQDSSMSRSSSPGAEEELWGTQQLQSISSPVISAPLTPELQGLEAQMEQHRRTIQRLKCFNQMLLGALQTCKGRSEGLSMRLGQREAETTALHLALQYSEQCVEAYGVLLDLRTVDTRTVPGLQAREGRTESAMAEAQRLLSEEDPTEAGILARVYASPEGSSVDAPTELEVAALLQSYIGRLRAHQALVKVSPEPDSKPGLGSSVPREEVIFQAMLGAQPNLELPRLEKTQIQQELATMREALVDLTLKLQLVKKEKRALELRDAAHRAQGTLYLLLLEQLQWQLGQGRPQDPLSSGESDSDSDSSCGAWIPGDRDQPAWPGGPRDSEDMLQELTNSLTRIQELQGQLMELQSSLEQMAQDERVQRARCLELTSDFCKAHSALVLAFRGAQRKQEQHQQTLDQQIALMAARQEEELESLAQVAQVLEDSGILMPWGETSL